MGVSLRLFAAHGCKSSRTPRSWCITHLTTR